jgi:hypothetical protein
MQQNQRQNKMALEKTIAYVEDDSGLRELVKDYFSLKLPNVKLVQFSNLRDFRLWHVSNHGGDLYICDGSFPEKPGQEAKVLWPRVASIVSLINKFSLYTTKGIILTSGEPQVTKNYEPFPIVQVIQKPFELCNLTAAVEKYLCDK